LITIFSSQVLSFNDQKFENPKTVRYSSIIQDNQLIKELLLLKDKQTSDISVPNSVRNLFLFNFINSIILRIVHHL
jgi:hypothetical protein